jgi:hypothetical protein
MFWFSSIRRIGVMRIRSLIRGPIGASDRYGLRGWMAEFLYEKIKIARRFIPPVEAAPGRSWYEDENRETVRPCIMNLQGMSRRNHRTSNCHAVLSESCRKGMVTV